MQTETKKTRSLVMMVLMIALPVAGQRLIDIGVNIADTVMLGTYGDIPLSASSLANQYYNIFSIMCMGISGGAGVLASQFWGAGDTLSYKKIMNLMARLCLIGTAVFVLATALIPRQIMEMFSNDGQVIEQGVQYLSIIVFVFFFHGITTCLSNILRSAGMAWLPFFVSCVSLFTNVFFNWVFIYGKLGFPEMRIRGAALGTLVARVIEFIIIVGYLLLKDKRIHYRLRDLRLKADKHLTTTYRKAGLPVIVSDMLLAFGNSTVAMVVGKLGVEMSAANSICSLVVQMTTAVIMGISTAGSVMVGQAVGKGDRREALKLGNVFLLISVIMGLIGGVVVLLITPSIVSFYNISALTREYADQLMYSFALILVFQSISSVLTKGVLRGGGDTKFLMIADVLFLWCASIPLGYLAGFVWGLSPFWIQIFLKIDMVFKSIWCAGRLRRGKWIKKLTAS